MTLLYIYWYINFGSYNFITISLGHDFVKIEEINIDVKLKKEHPYTDLGIIAIYKPPLDKISVKIVGIVSPIDSLESTYKYWNKEKEIYINPSTRKNEEDLEYRIKQRRTHLNPLTGNNYILPKMFVEIEGKHQEVLNENIRYIDRSRGFHYRRGEYAEYGSSVKEEYFTKEGQNTKLYYDSKERIFKDSITASGVISTLYEIPIHNEKMVAIKQSTLGHYFSAYQPYSKLYIDFQCKEIFNYDPNYSKIKINFEYNRFAVNIDKILPTPDILTPSYISYNDPLKVQQAISYGILVEGSNSIIKKSYDNLNFIIVTLIGIILSILAQIAFSHYKDIKKRK